MSELIKSSALLKILTIKDLRTMEGHIRAKHLPKPVMDGDQLFFDKEEVAKKLGTSIDEPFITSEAVALILNQTAHHVRYLAKKGAIPSYYLGKSMTKGTKLLFKASEIQVANKFMLTESSGYWNMQFKLQILEQLAIRFLDSTKNSTVLTAEEKRVFESVLTQDGKLPDLMKELNLGREKIRLKLYQGIAKFQSLNEYNDRMLEENYRLEKELANLRAQIGQLEKENGLLKGRTFQKRTRLKHRDETEIRYLPIERVLKTLTPHTLEKLQGAGIGDVDTLIKKGRDFLNRIPYFGPTRMERVIKAVKEVGFILA